MLCEWDEGVGTGSIWSLLTGFTEAWQAVVGCGDLLVLLFLPLLLPHPLPLLFLSPLPPSVPPSLPLLVFH